MSSTNGVLVHECVHSKLDHHHVWSERDQAFTICTLAPEYADVILAELKPILQSLREHKICAWCGESFPEDEVVWGEESDAYYCSDACMNDGEQDVAVNRAEERALQLMEAYG